jgi:hypothetical protein
MTDEPRSIPMNTPRGVVPLEWPAADDAPLTRLTRARAWAYRHTPQLIIGGAGVAALVALVALAAAR